MLSQLLLSILLLGSQIPDKGLDWRALSFFMEADYLVKEGKLEKADSVLSRGIEETGAPFLFLEMAKLKLREELPQEALLNAEHALKEMGKSPEVFKVILRIVPNLGKDTALSWVERALGDFPNDVEILSQSARILDFFDEGKKARELYQKLVTIAPDSLSYKADYASFLLREGEVDSALLYYEEVYDSLAGNYKVEVGFARALESKGELKEALKHYAVAQNRNPQNVGLLMKIAQIYLKLGSPEQALNVLNGAKAIGYFNPMVRQLLGVALYKMKKYYEAAEEFLAASSLDPKDPENPYYLSRIFYTLGDPEKAMNFIDRAISLDKKREDFKVYKSFLFVTMNKVEEALKILKKVKKEDPYVFSVKGHSYRMAGKLKEAEKYFRKALLMDSTNLQRYLNLYEVLLDQGKRDEARGILEEAKGRFKDNEDILFRLAELSSEEGKVQEAVKYYEELSRIDSTNATVYNNWGYLLAKEGVELNKAKALIDRALSLEPDNPIYLDSMGWVYFKLGDYKRALDYIKRALSMGVEDPEVLEHMGDVYEKLGDIEQAARYWKRALELAPLNSSLRQKIEDLEGYRKKE